MDTDEVKLMVSKSLQKALVIIKERKQSGKLVKTVVTRMKATTQAATMPPTSLTTITATTKNVLNASNLQVTCVDGARGVYVPFAAVQRESSKWLGGARSVTKNKVVSTKC